MEKQPSAVELGLTIVKNANKHAIGALETLQHQLKRAKCESRQRFIRRKIVLWQDVLNQTEDLLQQAANPESAPKVTEEK